MDLSEDKIAELKKKLMKLFSSTTGSSFKKDAISKAKNTNDLLGVIMKYQQLASLQLQTGNKASNDTMRLLVGLRRKMLDFFKEEQQEKINEHLEKTEERTEEIVENIEGKLEDVREENEEIFDKMFDKDTNELEMTQKELEALTIEHDEEFKKDLEKIGQVLHQELTEIFQQPQKEQNQEQEQKFVVTPSPTPSPSKKIDLKKLLGSAMMVGVVNAQQDPGEVVNKFNEKVQDFFKKLVKNVEAKKESGFEDKIKRINEIKDNVIKKLLNPDVNLNKKIKSHVEKRNSLVSKMQSILGKMIALKQGSFLAAKGERQDSGPKSDSSFLNPFSIKPKPASDGS